MKPPLVGFPNVRAKGCKRAVNGKKSPALAVEYLNDYCNNNAELVVDAWWDLGDQLLVKYNKLWYYNARERKREALKYPDWWLRELVKYNNLQPKPEK